MVILTGETHAMLYPCECHDSPGGGIAQRAFLLQELADKQQMLLLDAGGFSAGSMYDLYTEGRKNDSIRTIKTIRAMGQIGYDAVAIGDDDLQYGGKWLISQAQKAGVPLLSANSFLEDGSYLAKPYRIVEKGGITFGITAVTTAEELFSTDKSITIMDPISSISLIWDQMHKESDYQIILSHLGEESVEDLIENFPNTLIIGNGHRKSSTQPSYGINNTSVIQFSFQGKSLSMLKLENSEKGLIPLYSRWIPVSAGMKAHSGVASMLDEISLQDAQTVYDLYLMSMCQFGIDALYEFMNFQMKTGVENWNIWFVGSVEEDLTLRALNGEMEIEDQMLWLGVRELYPHLFPQFLHQRSASFATTRQLISSLNMDVNKINQWKEEHGDRSLRAHFLRSMRLQINASPTLFINNNYFGGMITSENLLVHECRNNVQINQLCQFVPECFTDMDCVNPGLLGKCVPDEKKGGICEFRQDVSFSIRVVVADTSYSNPEDNLIRKLINLFPSAETELIEMGSQAGLDLLHRYKPNALPFFIFDSAIKNAYNFPSVAGDFYEKDGSFFLNDGVIITNYLLGRENTTGQNVKLFLDPAMPNLNNVLNTIKGASFPLEQITVRPIIIAPSEKNELSDYEQEIWEEAARWLILSDHYPHKFCDYLSKFADKPDSLDWVHLIDSLGIEQNDFKKHFERRGEFLRNFISRTSCFNFSHPVTLVINNKHIIPLRSEKELLEYFYMLVESEG
ncbi:5'-nucleotidase [Chitinispirillum alkaliphilum]|nr:5'-nucleotidase [Chitinispirillum alkaliphilum]